MGLKSNMLSWCQANPMLAKHVPFQTPVRLLMSFPRSGSSWAATLAAQSPQLCYLREPVNTTYQQGTRQETFIQPENDTTYAQLWNTTLKGLLPLGSTVAKQPERFLPWRRKKYALLIKEVNPFALPYLSQHNNIITVFVVRHPLAIASSFKRLGWLDAPPCRKSILQTHHTGDKLTDFGALIALSFNLGKKHAALVLHHEDLFQDPHTHFATLFNAFSTPMPPHFEKLLQHYSGTADPKNPFDLKRPPNQKPATASHWSDEERTKIRIGYQNIAHDFYTTDAGW